MASLIIRSTQDRHFNPGTLFPNKIDCRKWIQFYYILTAPKRVRALIKLCEEYPLKVQLAEFFIFLFLLFIILLSYFFNALFSNKEILTNKSPEKQW